MSKSTARILLWGTVGAVSAAALFWSYVLCPCPVSAPKKVAQQLPRPHNFHEVVPSVVYRCEQINGQTLEICLREHGIKSVLNLRGAENGTEADWYKDELAVSKKLGVAHYDYKLSASERVSPAQIDEIVKILRVSPKPLLIHCFAGADRTGLVSTVYMYKIKGVPAKIAAKEHLRVEYGHNIIANPPTKAMDDSFWEYVERDTKANAASK